MKRTYSTFMILAGLLLQLLGGCNRTYPYSDTLLEVNQLLNNRQADSALTMPKFTSQILLLYSKVLHILENLLLKNFTGLKVVSWTGSQQQKYRFSFFW